MKREIKFRALTANPNLVKNHEPYMVFGLINETGNKDYPYSIDGCFVSPETIGQFTGLTDKNGVEIYEGDQLYVRAGYSSTVEFQDGMFVSVYRHTEDGETIPLLDAIGKDTIIIDNKGSDGHGLTKREYFAGMAMQGLLSNHRMIDNTRTDSLEWIGKHSIKLADELLKQMEYGNDKKG